MKIITRGQIAKLKSSIGESGVAHLQRLHERGCEVWFLPNKNAANLEPGLTAEEREFARRRLDEHPWTWIHRPVE